VQKVDLDDLREIERVLEGREGDQPAGGEEER